MSGQRCDIATPAVGTYSVAVKCANCRYGTHLTTEHIDIPRGSRIEHYLARQSCPECGCKTIERKELW